MIETVLVTIFPVGFLIVLFAGGALFSKRKIEQGGEAPINKTLFVASKYSVIALWGAMVVQAWGINISFVEVPRMLQLVALGIWIFGFTFLYLGRLTMGDSFRLGSAKEETHLATGGLFRISRNPMYVGMYSTLVASSLYTLNPIVIAIAAFVIAVHHRIVLAEEQHLQNVFGREYAEYCRRVGRYLSLPSFGASQSVAMDSDRTMR
jgi:protein-S-isoprenylcysteine O-methyltransferase Ste14